MRKVFLSIMILSKIRKTEYISDSFHLSDVSYQLPMSYVMDETVNEGEEITVITCVEKNINGETIAEKNYEFFKAEVESIAEKHALKVNYDIIPMSSEFGEQTFNYFFKTIAKKLKDGDELYLDLTFGMKPYNISMFIAAAYAVKACTDASIACAFYSQKFTGSREAKEVEISKIYDLTGLIYLTDFAGKVQPGDKELADSMLDMMMPETGEV